MFTFFHSFIYLEGKIFIDLNKLLTLFSVFIIINKNLSYYIPDNAN